MAIVLACLLVAAPAAVAHSHSASTRRPSVTTVTKTVVTSSASSPVLVTDLDKPPAGYRLTAAEVLRIASRAPRVIAELHRHRRAIPYEYTKGPGQWQVSWFSQARPQKELLQVYVSDVTGRVTQAWAGYQVAWSMARGYAGAFGRSVNLWPLWLALCIAFVAPFISWRRRPTLLHLDLAMLLGFSVSLAFFNHGEIGLSVPLVYPFMLYLAARMALLAFGRGVPREPLHTNVSVPWLILGIVFIGAFRITLNVLNSNVIDVGYAGVIGADKLIHGIALYGHWPQDNLYGDTYGPVSYAIYVPFRVLLGWSGTWDSLPAAHGAAIFFDLLTCAELYVLGRRIRDNRLGTLLVYGWVAYPFTLYAMNSNTNDSLVAAAVVLALLVVSSPPGRGVVAALAGLTKFAPFVLAPLLMRGIGDRPDRRSRLRFAAAFAISIVVCMLPVLLNHDLHAFWHDSIEYQSDRAAPFSIWGLWGGLSIEQHLLQGAVVAAALGVYFLPARRGIMQLAALAAALLIALEMTTTYWLYPYIVWFFPLVLVALFAAHPVVRESHRPSWDPLEHDRNEPIPIQIVTG